MRSIVSLSRCNDEDIKEAVFKAIELTDFRPKKINSVVIKPNLCYYWDAVVGETTDPRVVSAIIDYVREFCNPDADIQIAEADASAMKTRHVFKMLRYTDLASDKEVKLLNLCDDEFREIDVKIKNFSKGMRQKIGIVSSIVHDPDIIVLDEPQTGLDPTARLLVREFILKLKEQGKTIFLSSHLLYEISEIADRIAIISHGKLVAIDTLENLESMGKLSVIHLELNVPKEEVESYIPTIVKTIQPYISDSNKSISLDKKTGIIKIPFDGEPAHQTAILNSLVKEGLDVIEFSVPKAGLLEDLYIEFVNKRQEELL